MKRVSLLLVLFIGMAGHAQDQPPSAEAFVNAVRGLVVDSGFSHYYLLQTAAPCSFKKFDYDEWLKYALKEDVPVYILNELSKKSYSDTSPRNWQPGKLQQADCIDEESAKKILLPVLTRHAANNYINHPESRTVFYFSRPAFTDDYQYAIIDMGYRCDNRQCGMGTTFLFKQVKGSWQLAGKKMAWGN